MPHLELLASTDTWKWEEPTLECLEVGCLTWNNWASPNTWRWENIPVVDPLGTATSAPQ
jgi:hypothetical protein